MANFTNFIKLHKLFKELKLLNQTVYAKKYGITKQALQYYIKNGKVDFIRLGETIFIVDNEFSRNA